jgi:phospholipase C
VRSPTRCRGYIADTYHALADAGHLDNTVLVITFDEWGGFYDHVRPARVIDDTGPATGTIRAIAQRRRLVPDYTQVGFRVSAIVVSNFARARVASAGPFEHTSTLKMIEFESTFGLHPLTARDANATCARSCGTRSRAPSPAPSRPAARCGDAQRRRRSMQRLQRPVGLALPGIEGQANHRSGRYPTARAAADRCQSQCPGGADPAVPVHAHGT